MKPLHVTVVDFEELRSIPGDWKREDLAALLEDLDVEGTGEMNDGEIREMCILGLQDLEPEEAATLVLGHKFNGLLSEGQIRNFSIECQDEKLWEQSGDMERHRTMFSVASLLAEVSEQQFPTPDAARVTLDVAFPNEADANEFTKEATATDLVAMLSTGMDDQAVLNRMFSREIQAGDFHDGHHIIWEVQYDVSAGATVRVRIISSGYWLDSLQTTESFDWTPIQPDQK